MRTRTMRCDAKKRSLVAAVGVALSAVSMSGFAAEAAWVTAAKAAGTTWYTTTGATWSTAPTNINYGYTGSTGTITFNDWGYVGPNNGSGAVGANDFQVGSGFDSSNIGQIQHVVTTGPDWNTPDPAHDILGDLDYDPYMPNANMDSGVNFYYWGYTTKAGSTFNNMQIDKAGNYHIAKQDMSFMFYDEFQYKDGNAAPTPYDTKINFQPYAISDAKGWCGSVLNQNPGGVAMMAGQVTFDFAFDAFLNNDGVPGVIAGPGAATQIVPGFVMRSYGSYEVNVNVGDDPDQHLQYFGSAVMNNTNPLTGQLDPDSQNEVSFLGAGVVPVGVWVFNDGTPDVQVVDPSQCPNNDPSQCAGATFHSNSFAGFPFLMRADGIRILDYVNPTGHSNYVATVVPLPAAVWLMGSGLLGLAGLARRGTKRVLV